MARKKPSRPKSVEEGQRIAREIARTFVNFQCDLCAMEIAATLGKEFDAAFVRLATADNSDPIGLVRDGIQISTNKVHVGVKIGESVFDNLHHNGLQVQEWACQFAAWTGALLIQESRPIGEFFHEGIQTKQFRRWLFGDRPPGGPKHGNRS